MFDLFWWPILFGFRLFDWLYPYATPYWVLEMAVHVLCCSLVGAIYIGSMLFVAKSIDLALTRVGIGYLGPNFHNMDCVALWSYHGYVAQQPGWRARLETKRSLAELQARDLC